MKLDNIVGEFSVVEGVTTCGRFGAVFPLSQTGLKSKPSMLVSSQPVFIHKKCLLIADKTVQSWAFSVEGNPFCHSTNLALV